MKVFIGYKEGKCPVVTNTQAEAMKLAQEKWGTDARVRQFSVSEVFDGNQGDGCEGGKCVVPEPKKLEET